MSKPKKGAAHTLYSGPPDKGGIIQRAAWWLYDKIKGFKTYGLKCLAFDIS